MGSSDHFDFLLPKSYQIPMHVWFIPLIMLAYATIINDFVQIHRDLHLIWVPAL